MRFVALTGAGASCNAGSLASDARSEPQRAASPEANYRIRWKRIADYPARLSEVSAIASLRRVLVVGGKVTNDNQDLADNRDVDVAHEYEPATDKWILRTGMPTARYDVGLAELDGRIYAVSSQNESYDPVSDTWRRHAPLPHGGAHVDVAAVGGEIFAFGVEGAALCAQNMAFDPKTDSWHARAPIPTPRLFPVVATLDGKIYVMGGLGYDEEGRLGQLRHDVEVYDPATDQWKKKPPIPDGVYGAVGAGVFDGKVFLVGVSKGTRLADTILSAEVYVHDPAAGNWLRVPDTLPHKHGGAGVAFLDGGIYLVGGHDESFRQFSDAYVGKIER